MLSVPYVLSFCLFVLLSVRPSVCPFRRPHVACRNAIGLLFVLPRTTCQDYIVTPWLPRPFSSCRAQDVNVGNEPYTPRPMGLLPSCPGRPSHEGAMDAFRTSVMLSKIGLASYLLKVVNGVAPLWRSRPNRFVSYFTVTRKEVALTMMGSYVHLPKLESRGTVQATQRMQDFI
jgi:hypothetical protein